MHRKALEKLELEEREQALDCASKARQFYRNNPDADLTLLAQKVFDANDAQSHVDGKGLGKVKAFSGRTLVPIYPCRDEATFKNWYGYNIADFCDLAKRRHILPLLQRPLSYEGLDYLTPLLKLSPPSYFIRGGLLYAILFDDDLDYVTKQPHLVNSPKFLRHVHVAMEKPLIQMSSHPRYRKCREPYQNEPAWPEHSNPQKLIESFAFKYAHACCFLGENIVNDILDDLESGKALALRTYVHMRLDHPISHGLVTPEHNPTPEGEHTKASLALTNAFRDMERWVTPKRCTLTVPLNPSADYLDKLEESDPHERALNAMQTIDPNNIGMAKFRNTLQEAYGSLQEKVERIDSSSK